MRDPGKAGWLLPPDLSPLRDGDVQSGSLAFLPPRGARGVTVVEVLLMPWGSPGFEPCPCPLPLASLAGYCWFYLSQIRSPGKMLVPAQCRWLKPH